MNAKNLLLLILLAASVLLVERGLQKGLRPAAPVRPAASVHSTATSSNSRGMRPDPSTSRAASNVGTPPVNTEHPGWEVFRLSKCDQCHGSDLAGTRMGPPLMDLARHWDAHGLAAYLKDPLNVASGDERLRKLVENYRMAPMPSAQVEGQQLEQLTAFLLAPLRP